MKIWKHTNKYGSEIRIHVSKGRAYIVNLSGCIGDETSNSDLWNRGWRIGFAKYSRHIAKLGIYIFLATKE